MTWYVQLLSPFRSHLESHAAAETTWTRKVVYPTVLRSAIQIALSIPTQRSMRLNAIGATAFSELQKLYS